MLLARTQVFRCAKPTTAAGGAKRPLNVARGFRLEQVIAATSPQDIVLAKQEGPSLFSFFAFPGLSAKEVTERLLMIPQADRHVHTVFGRGGAKVDLALDLDFALCDVPKSNKKYYTKDSVVLETLSHIKKYYKDQLHVSEPSDIVVLDGHSTKKHSVHIHVRSAEGVFPDFKSAKDALAEINADLTTAAIDLGVMRPNGTMRIAYAPKFDDPSRSLLPFKAKDSALVKELKFMHSELTEADILERSLIVHPGATGKAFRGTASKSRTIGYDEFGHAVSPFMEESKKWLRYKECVSTVKRYPISFAEEYDTWIRIGLALHSFGNDAHIKEQWKAMSSRCRQKYNPSVCDKLWEKFSSRPNCYNWRRGYNYIVLSLGKKLRGVDASS